MKTTTLTIGDKTYDASLLTFAEYKRCAQCYGEIQRAAVTSDMAASLAGIGGLVQVLHAALSRVDSKITLGEIENQISPGETMELAGLLMKASNSVSMPAPGREN